LLVAALGMRQVSPGEVPARVTPLVERTAVQPGSTVRLALEVALPDGLHVQSNRPRDPSLIPTTLTIDPAPGLSDIRIAFPPPADFLLQGLDEPLAVFESTFLIGVEATVADGQSPGELVVPARLRYQA